MRKKASEAGLVPQRISGRPLSDHVLRMPSRWVAMVGGILAPTRYLHRIAYKNCYSFWPGVSSSTSYPSNLLSRNICLYLQSYSPLISSPKRGYCSTRLNSISLTTILLASWFNTQFYSLHVWYSSSNQPTLAWKAAQSPCILALKPASYSIKHNVLIPWSPPLRAPCSKHCLKEFFSFNPP